MIDLEIYRASNEEEFIRSNIDNVRFAEVVYKMYKSACDLFNYSNVALWKRSETQYIVIVKFGNISFTNKTKKIYEMQNVYAGFSIIKESNNTLYIKTKVMRTKFTPSEFYSNYCWSHVPTAYLSLMENRSEMFVDPSKVCVGSGTFPETIQLLSVSLNKEILTEEDWKNIDLGIEDLWYKLRYLYLTYESIEGTPYIRRESIISPPRDNIRTSYYISNNGLNINSNTVICSRRVIKDIFRDISNVLKRYLYIKPTGFGIYMNGAVEEIDRYFVSKYKEGITFPGINVFNLIDNTLYLISQQTIINDQSTEYDTSVMKMLSQLSNKYIIFRGEKITFELDLTNIPRKVNSSRNLENLTIGTIQAQSIVLKYLNILNENYEKYTFSKRDTDWYRNNSDFTSSLNQQESTFNYS